MITYLTAISEGYPGVIVTASGNGSIYDDIVLVSGGPLPSKAELDAYILQYARDKKWIEIKAERDRRQQTGGTFVSPNWFHSDPVSRQQQMGLVMMQDNMPTGIMWKTMSGSFVEMTPDLAEAIFNGAVLTDQASFANAEIHKAALLVSSDPENYDYSTGWPAVYTP